jgi:hypothetical protein
MDFWRCLLAVAQVAAAVQINFDEVESAPMGIKVHHVDALREYAKATQDNLSKLAKRILEQATFLWGRMEEISSKAAVNDVFRPIRAISKIATTITAHRLDRAVMDLVIIQKVFSDYAERLEENGWYIELNGWQDVFHLDASYHASADTLTVAVRLPLLRRESQGYNLYKSTFFPIMHGLHLYDIRTECSIKRDARALLSLCSLYYVSCLREGYQIYIKPKTSDETTPPFLVCHWYMAHSAV